MLTNYIFLKISSLLIAMVSVKIAFCLLKFEQLVLKNLSSKIDNKWLI